MVLFIFLPCFICGLVSLPQGFGQGALGEAVALVQA